MAPRSRGREQSAWGRGEAAESRLKGPRCAFGRLAKGGSGRAPVLSVPTPPSSQPRLGSQETLNKFSLTGTLCNVTSRLWPRLGEGPAWGSAAGSMPPPRPPREGEMKARRTVSGAAAWLKCRPPHRSLQVPNQLRRHTREGRQAAGRSPVVWSLPVLP